LRAKVRQFAAAILLIVIWFGLAGGNFPLDQSIAKLVYPVIYRGRASDGSHQLAQILPSQSRSSVGHVAATVFPSRGVYK
jgi:hypothetical protein